MQIPLAPDSLSLDINSLWNGSPHPDPLHHAHVELQQLSGGIKIKASALSRPNLKIPDAPLGRLDGLWEYDVVEVFFAGSDSYLEIELGAGGHWLVLAFDAVRHRSDDFSDMTFETSHQVHDRRWENEITIPWDVVPKGVARMNAFAIAGGAFLALNPVPGEIPDFHQPSTFPEITIER